jgi:hypothetical protein
MHTTTHNAAITKNERLFLGKRDRIAAILDDAFVVEGAEIMGWGSKVGSIMPVFSLSN